MLKITFLNAILIENFLQQKFANWLFVGFTEGKQKKNDQLRLRHFRVKSFKKMILKLNRP